MTLFFGRKLACAFLVIFAELGFAFGLIINCHGYLGLLYENQGQNKRIVLLYVLLRLTAWDEAGDGGAARKGGEFCGCGGASRFTVSAYDVIAADGLGVSGPFSATSDDREGNNSSPSPSSSPVDFLTAVAGCS